MALAQGLGTLQRRALLAMSVSFCAAGAGQELEQTASFEELQATVGEDPKNECPQPCLLQYKVSSTVQYRTDPKPIIKGIAYGLTPVLRGVNLPKYDSTSEEAAIMWASWGRADLATIRTLGANTVRLYGNDPLVNKRAFLDEALKQSLDVILGMSEYPYFQAEDNCKSNGFDCFDEIYNSYRQMLQNGVSIAVNGRRVYHPVVKAIVVFNEPEFKILHKTGDCKAIISAVDAMLQVEKDLEVDGNPIAFSTAYSLARKYGAPATGSMIHLNKCFMDPQRLALYKPRNDVKTAYLTRWVNSYNTPSPYRDQLTLLGRYGRSPCWSGNVRIPILISEYHAPTVRQDSDLGLMLNAAKNMDYPFFLGYCFYEFQKRFDKKDTAAFEGIFGIYGMRKTCEIGNVAYLGNEYTIHGIEPSGGLEEAVRKTFGGEVPSHECPRVQADTSVLSHFGQVEPDTKQGVEESAEVAARRLEGNSTETDVDPEELDLEGDLQLLGPSGASGTGKLTGALGDSVNLEFEKFAVQHNLAATMTPRELAKYKERFEMSAKRKAKAMDITLGANFDHTHAWKNDLDNSLVEEMPVVTEHLVEKVNAQDLGWTAEAESSEDLSMADAKALLGYLRDPEIENTTLAHFSETVRHLASFPSSFDSREKWPYCRETISHVRDQGKCGSCWAQAVAGMMDGRTCIATRGKFSGDEAWISSGYLTSCYNMLIINGCQGGNPGWAMARIKKSFIPGIGGVPTGSEKANTCVPYFASGDALQHFDAGTNVKAPPCPRKCTGKYSRDLSRDKFYTSSSPTTSANLADAKRALIEGGPIPMAFTVFQDFMAYKSGYYDRASDKQLGGHATTLIGWERVEYLVSANSWSTRWGEEGFFKMKHTCCGVSYFIADVGSYQSSLPLPHSGPAADSVAKPAGGGSKPTSHRRRFWNRAAFLNRASFDIQAPDESEKGGEKVDSRVLEGSEHVVLEIAGLNCAHLGAKEQAAARAASLAIVGKLDRLLGGEGAVIDPVSKLLGQVAVLPCTLEELGKPGQPLKSTSQVAEAKIELPGEGPWSCGGHAPAKNTTGIYFVVKTSQELLKGTDSSEAVKAAVEDVGFKEAVERRLREALPGHAGDIKVVRECFTNQKMPRAATLGVYNAGRNSGALAGTSSSSRGFVSIMSPWLYVPALMLAGVWCAAALFWRARSVREWSDETKYIEEGEEYAEGESASERPLE